MPDTFNEFPLSPIIQTSTHEALSPTFEGAAVSVSARLVSNRRRKLMIDWNPDWSTLRNHQEVAQQLLTNLYPLPAHLSSCCSIDGGGFLWVVRLTERLPNDVI